ncbi:PEGA domain-containing protein [Methanoplanus endosymbiosus]|uniref:PEGA domain-containing protein n=1 Tax=Methanoplanus endosymbiosus TaxID=33865 RepID=A0A9E7PRW8_9EURY|nr:PEGA domain-containing protein [Methanoplanus endosymbiosus]UUX92497.1 PEGA domain-containing protein [Methanoplanus endosymbiosus]
MNSILSVINLKQIPAIKNQKNILLIIFIMAIISIQAAAANPVGSVDITTDPPGADIYLDQIKLDYKTDILINGVDVGLHSLGLELTGYDPYYISNLEVLTNTKTYVKHTFEKPQDNIIISSSPKGAEVYIDSIYYGITPAGVSLDPGTYNFRIELDGYLTSESEYNADPYSISGDTYFELEPVPDKGSLIVTSIPDNALIYLDGKRAGTTSFRLNEIEPGEHTIRLEKSGFDSLEETVVISEYEDNIAEFIMHPQAGIISVDSVPAKGQVYINEKYLGKTPFSDYFEQGSYEIIIKSEAFEDYSEEIELGNDGESLLAVLTPSAEKLIISAEEEIEKNLKYEPDTAINYLNQSRKELEGKDYISSEKSAKTAISYAKDVDGDGLPNTIDIQPKIRNPYIYLIPLILFLIIILIIYIDYRRCSLNADAEISEIKSLNEEGIIAVVNLTSDNYYRGFVCSVYLDEKLTEIITDLGMTEVSIEKIPSGSHELKIKFVIDKWRYGTKTIEKSINFDINDLV